MSRATVTALFSDLVGSTQLGRSGGHAVEGLRRHHDRALNYFGMAHAPHTPTTAEADRARELRAEALLAEQEPGLATVEAAELLS